MSVEMEDEPSRRPGSGFKTVEWGEGVWLWAQRWGGENGRCPKTQGIW